MTETNRRSESALQRLREVMEREEQADSGLRRLAQVVTGQPDRRIMCSACEEALPAYVDDEISGVDVAGKHPDVKHHLDLCEACASTYAHLLQLAWEMEQHAAALPALESALDLSFLPRLTFQEKIREYVSALADELTPMLAPQDMDILEAIRDTVFAQLEALGKPFQLQEAAPAALGFDSEVPEGLRILATTYVATLEIASATPATVLQQQMQEPQWAEELRPRVEKIARGTGMARQRARDLAQRYVELVTSRPEVLIELAVEEE
ncbi:MAG: zf-HC2 domain-containing protein [Chloroflexi bacterium]|nr:zf-HC2 domain-containing protein [Chloroflexota bacterium]